MCVCARARRASVTMFVSWWRLAVAITADQERKSVPVVGLTTAIPVGGAVPDVGKGFADFHGLGSWILTLLSVNLFLIIVKEVCIYTVYRRNRNRPTGPHRPCMHR